MEMSNLTPEERAALYEMFTPERRKPPAPVLEIALLVMLIVLLAAPVLLGVDGLSFCAFWLIVGMLVVLVG